MSQTVFSCRYYWMLCTWTLATTGVKTPFTKLRSRSRTNKKGKQTNKNQTKPKPKYQITKTKYPPKRFSDTKTWGNKRTFLGSLFLAAVSPPCRCTQCGVILCLAPASWACPCRLCSTEPVADVQRQQLSRPGAGWGCGGTYGQSPPGQHGSAAAAWPSRSAQPSAGTAPGLSTPAMHVSLPPVLVFPSFCQVPTLRPSGLNSTSVLPLSPARQRSE